MINNEWGRRYFMSNDQFNILDEQLKQTKDYNKPFGGYSIVFAGDFCQLEPNGITLGSLLFLKKFS